MGYFFKNKSFDTLSKTPIVTKKKKKRKKRKNKKDIEIVNKLDGSKMIKAPNNKGIIQHIYINTGNQRQRGKNRNGRSKISQLKGNFNSTNGLATNLSNQTTFQKRRDYPVNINNSLLYMSQYKVNLLEHKLKTMESDLGARYNENFNLLRNQGEDTRNHLIALNQSNQHRIDDLRELNEGHLRTHQSLIEDRNHYQKQLSEAHYEFGKVGQFLRSRDKMTHTTHSNLDGGVSIAPQPIIIQLRQEEKQLSTLNKNELATNLNELSKLLPNQLKQLAKQGHLNKSTIIALKQEGHISDDDQDEIINLAKDRQDELQQKVKLTRLLAREEGRNLDTHIDEVVPERIRRERARGIGLSEFTQEPQYSSGDSTGSRLSQRSGRSKKSSDSGSETINVSSSEADTSYRGRPLDEQTQTFLKSKRDIYTQIKFKKDVNNKTLGKHKKGDFVPLHTNKSVADVLGVNEDTTQSDIEALATQLKVSGIKPNGSRKSLFNLTKQTTKSLIKQQELDLKKNWNEKEWVKGVNRSSQKKTMKSNQGLTLASKQFGIDPFIRDADNFATKVISFAGKTKTKKATEVQSYNKPTTSKSVEDAKNSLFSGTLEGISKSEIASHLSSKKITPLVASELHKVRRDELKSLKVVQEKKRSEKPVVVDKVAVEPEATSGESEVTSGESEATTSGESEAQAESE